MTLTCDTCGRTGAETVTGFVTATFRVPGGNVTIDRVCHGCRDRAKRAGTIVTERPFGVAAGATVRAGDTGIGRGPHGAYVVKTPSRVRAGIHERDERPDTRYRATSDCNRPHVPVAGPSAGPRVVVPGRVPFVRVPGHGGCIA
jgi:hypothetical protein